MAPRRDLFGVPSASHEPAVQAGLVVGVQAADRLRQLPVDVGHGARDALAGVRVAAVAQLRGLELAGGGARRHGGPPRGAGPQAQLHLDRRVAAAVEDLAAVDVLDRAHRAGCLPDRGPAPHSSSSPEADLRVVAELALGREIRPLRALGARETRGGLHTPREPAARRPQRQLRVDAQLAGDVDRGEQQVARPR